ncbi:MAG: glycosyltransferase family 2 protein [Clostridiales bacterium]|nr:glycosyltransferase family 2 protein [Clostridiales bacterium]
MITGSVVIFNSPKKLIENVIKSFSPNKERKLFIIDNSEKKTEQYLNKADIEYIYNGRNLGYGAAHNIGIKKAIEEKADYHIVLNPDISFVPNIIDELISYANINEDVVYILPKVVNADGKLQYLCKLLPTPFDLIFRRFFPKIKIVEKRNDRYILKKSGYREIMNPPCLSGCFMFMRVSTLKRYDLKFDERFFMYCEDFDLIRRMHRVGKTIYYPNVTIVHIHGKESYKNLKMLKMHMKSACQYFHKYGWLFDMERRKMNEQILREL